MHAIGKRRDRQSWKESVFYRFYAALAASVSCGMTTPSFGHNYPVISPAVPSEAPDNVPLPPRRWAFPWGRSALSDFGYSCRLRHERLCQSAGQQTACLRSDHLRCKSGRREQPYAQFRRLGAFGFWQCTAQNYQNFGFNTDGRVDIQRTEFSVSAAFTGTTELLTLLTWLSLCRHRSCMRVPLNTDVSAF